VKKNGHCTGLPVYRYEDKKTGIHAITGYLFKRSY
jgi:hypothetical protein